MKYDEKGRLVSVFIVQHVHEFDADSESIKLIGVYADRVSAEEAVSRASVLPGFREARAGFSVEEYTLGQDEWKEGYVTMTD